MIFGILFRLDKDEFCHSEWWPFEITIGEFSPRYVEIVGELVQKETKYPTKVKAIKLELTEEQHQLIKEQLKG